MENIQKLPTKPFKTNSKEKGHFLVKSKKKWRWSAPTVCTWCRASNPSEAEVKYSHLWEQKKVAGSQIPATTWNSQIKVQFKTAPEKYWYYQPNWNVPIKAGQGSLWPFLGLLLQYKTKKTKKASWLMWDQNPAGSISYSLHGDQVFPPKKVNPVQ